MRKSRSNTLDHNFGKSPAKQLSGPPGEGLHSSRGSRGGDFSAGPPKRAMTMSGGSGLGKSADSIVDAGG